MGTKQGELHWPPVAGETVKQLNNTRTGTMRSMMDSFQVGSKRSTEVGQKTGGRSHSTMHWPVPATAGKHGDISQLELWQGQRSAQKEQEAEAPEAGKECPVKTPYSGFQSWPTDSDNKEGSKAWGPWDERQIPRK